MATESNNQQEEQKNRRLLMIGGGICIALLILALLGFLMSQLLGSGETKRRKVQKITLLKPPPPPKIKEEPPKPKVEKKKEIVKKEEPPPEPEPLDEPNLDESIDDTLGLDADAGPGAAGYGLKAKKGGKSIIGSNFGRASLLRKYGWYASIVESEIRDRILEILDKQRRRMQVVVRVRLDDTGRITDCRIIGSSGDPSVDSRVSRALKGIRISEPPPAEMPRSMKIRIRAKG